MAKERFEVVDTHLCAWPAEGLGACVSPRSPATFDEPVFRETLAQMDRLGIRQGVLSGPDTVTLEWCRRAADRFIPLWYPGVRLDDPEEEAACFADAVESSGVRGLGELMMHYGGLAVNDERLFPLYRVCAERNLPVFCHTGLDGRDLYRWAPSFSVELVNPLLFEDVLAALPDLTIVMCHLSYPFTEQATYMLYAHANVYMDVATVSWILGQTAFHRLLRQVVETVGADKILFGTDQMGRPDRIAVAVNAIQEASFLSREDKRKILGDNARRLLGLAAPAAAPRSRWWARRLWPSNVAEASA